MPTHNPHADRLRAALQGLRAQILPHGEWELIVVDNASVEFPEESFFRSHGPTNFRLSREDTLGLTAARRNGFEQARGAVAVLVDDDNVLAPDYLHHVLSLFATHPQIGVAGGKSIPVFEKEPPPWAKEFFPLLALRDLGDARKIAHGLQPSGKPRNEYPPFAPLGAGMAIRREAWEAWLSHSGKRPSLTDRRGTELSSGGDNDIILCALSAGWEAGYFPELQLTHLIPASRLDADYLARLNRGIQKSWMQVLSAHDANPWSPIPRWTVPLRQLKAWVIYRAWSNDAAHIRWQGACGHFEGRASV